MSQSNEEIIRDVVNFIQSKSQQGGGGAPEQLESGRAPTNQRTQKKPTSSKDDSPRSVDLLYQALSIEGADTNLDVATCVLNLSDELVNMSAGGSFKQQVLDNYIAKAGSVTSGQFVVDAKTLAVNQVGGVWDVIKKAAQVVGPVVLDAAVKAVKEYIAPSASSTVKGASNNHSAPNKVTTKVNPVAFLEGLTNTAQQITDGLANIEATKAAAHYLSQVQVNADGFSDDPDQLLAYSFACKQCCNVAGDHCMEAFKKILSSEDVTSLLNSEKVSAEELGGLWDIVTSVAGAAAGTVVPVLGPLAVDAASSFLKKLVSSDSYQASLVTESASTTKALNGANGAKSQSQKLKLHSATSFGRALVNEDNSVNTSALYHQMDLLSTVAKAPVKKAYGVVAGDTAGRAAQVTQDVIMNYMDQNVGEDERADFLERLQPAVSALGKVYLTMPKALQGPSDVTNDNLSNTDSTRANAIHLAMDSTVNNLLNVSQLPSQSGKLSCGGSVQGGFGVWNLIKSAAGPVLGTAISTIMPLFSQQPQAGQA